MRRMILGMVFALVGCGGGDSSTGPTTPVRPAPVLATLSFAVTPSSVSVGGTATATLTALDQFGAPFAVGSIAFSSTPATVATVNASGVVTAISPGVATIAVNAGTISATAQLRVTTPPPVLASLSVTLPAATLASGQQATAEATGRDQYGAPISLGSVTWSVGTSGVATVTPGGVVTAVLVGQTTIRAQSGAVFATVPLTVTPGPATQLAFSIPPAGVRNGLTFTTQPVLAVRDAAGNAITSDNTTTVSISANGGTSVVGPTSRTVVGGIASFFGTGVSGAVGASYSLTYSAAGLAPIAQSGTIPVFTFGIGTKIVGVDVPSGLFRSTNANTASCYWARLSGFGGTLAEILANSINGGPSVVAIEASDRGFESASCATWSQVMGAVTASQTANFDAGTFIVGTDIAPGTWRSNGSGTGCYWARQKSFSGKISDVIANYFGSASAVVTISPTDVGFTSSGCGSWARV